MKQVDFYQLTRDPVEAVVALLARKTVQAGERLVVVSENAQQREAISRALWSEGGGAFLAHGEAGERHAARQPVLLSESCHAPNEARFVLLADGKWRAEAESFARVFLLFDEAGRDAARDLWREFKAREDVTFKAHRQDENGRWNPL